MIYSFAGDRRKRTSEEEDEKRRSRTRKGRKSNRRGRRRMRSKGTHQKKSVFLLGNVPRGGRVNLNPKVLR